MAYLLYGTRFDNTNTTDKFVVYSLPFGFANTLDENLLGGLNSIATEVGKIQFLL